MSEGTVLGVLMDRRRVELQIRAVLVTYRGEHRRRDSTTMGLIRARSHLLLDQLDEAARPFPDLQTRLDEARLELDRE